MGSSSLYKSDIWDLSLSLQDKEGQGETISPVNNTTPHTHRNTAKIENKKSEITVIVLHACAYAYVCVRMRVCLPAFMWRKRGVCACQRIYMKELMEYGCMCALL